MPYVRKFMSKARDELEQCCETYGPNLKGQIYAWLDRIVIATESGETIGTLDVMEVIRQTVENGGGQWRNSAKKWWDATLVNKVRAIFYTIRNRCPPWDLRMAVGYFDVISTFQSEITVFYAVDHIKKQVIFTGFDGLPGQ